jgi:hypothetical protein
VTLKERKCNIDFMYILLVRTSNMPVYVIILVKKLMRNRESAVGIATGSGLDDRGPEVRVPVGSRIFSSPRRPDRLWGSTQPPIQWVPRALSPGVKREERDADQ